VVGFSTSSRCRSRFENGTLHSSIKTPLSRLGRPPPDKADGNDITL
jgi:hypothetical protein